MITLKSISIVPKLFKLVLTNAVSVWEVGTVRSKDVIRILIIYGPLKIQDIYINLNVNGIEAL